MYGCEGEGTVPSFTRSCNFKREAALEYLRTSSLTNIFTHRHGYRSRNQIDLHQQQYYPFRHHSIHHLLQRGSRKLSACQWVPHRWDSALPSGDRHQDHDINPLCRLLRYSLAFNCQRTILVDAISTK